MKHLIIYAHPNPESLNSHLKDTLLEYLQHVDNEVVVRDLYQLHFDPTLSLEDMAGQRKGEVSQDVKTEQDYITWADCITIIHPIWWTGLPAIMKGYIDRVFSYGFAYRYDKGVQKGLLTGKKVVIINTHGKSNAEYKGIKMDKALSLTSDTGIYAYSGLDILNHFFFDQADRATAENIGVWEREIISTFKSEFDIAIIESKQ
ncbi:NAD(P)H-dependent oxidoreductase [Membranihabitans marinus]|uniref:NAD(P)H-dependent oxidoreductase n=1 Tax=Membranihabitans marinus TaxID=1227546 RepID=UPI001F2A416A|nr:NAD(P)H-dependent oxidoreductase [Membranihabitans marinus]